MRYPTRVRAEARTQVSPWWFWALAAVAAVFLSFGCHGSFYDSDYENGGGAGGEGGDDGGAAGTPLVITSTLSSTEVNEINGDEIGVVKFSFDMPVDQESAADYITLYAQYVDGTEEAIPINAIFWSEDGLSVELSFAAAYNTSYLVNFSAGLKSADLTATLMENITYQLKTLRNPLDIDGADGDRADVVVGNPSLKGEVRGGLEFGLDEIEKPPSLGMVLLGDEIVSAKLVEMTILCDLMSANCLTADFRVGFDDEGAEVILSGREILPWNYPGQEPALGLHSYVGANARNLGNVTGDWRADFTITANKNVSEPYCNEGEGSCVDNACVTEEQPQGASCGCLGTDTCMEHIYQEWDLNACIPDDGLLGCSNDTDCTVVHGLGEGYYCMDAGVDIWGNGLPDFCASTVGSCGNQKCYDLSAYQWYCNADAQECYSYANEYGACLYDQKAVALLWDDIADEAPAASFASATTFPSDSKPYPEVALSVSPIGDVNADGRADLIVVEQGGNDFLQQQLHLFLGREGFSGEILLSTADASWSPPAAVPGMVEASMSLPPGLSLAQDLNPPLLAASIVGLGDVNGDGIGDFGIGSIEQDFLMGGPSAGVVQLFFGSQEVAALKVADVTITSGVADDLFGVSLAGGDVDGDRKADLLIGAPGPKGGGKIIIEKNIAVMPSMVELEGPVASLVNRAYLFSGAMLTGGSLSAANATATFIETAVPKDSPMLGLAVAITDLNGDRLGDIAIGEPFLPTANSQGRVGIFLGKAGIAGTVEMARADLFINHNWPTLYDEWGNPGDLYSLGVQLSAIGDINNDGYKDLAVAGITRSLWGGMAQDGNYLCMFPGSASLGEINLDCDNSNAWVTNIALPDLLVRILGGGRVK